jgi:hypothetical protein
LTFGRSIFVEGRLIHSQFAWYRAQLCCAIKIDIRQQFLSRFFRAIERGSPL